MGLGYIYDIIISPITTEKTSLQSSENKFTFKVNIVKTKGKTKRFRGKIGKKSNVKKAIVTMKKGQQIDLTKLEGK